MAITRRQLPELRRLPQMHSVMMLYIFRITLSLINLSTSAK